MGAAPFDRLVSKIKERASSEVQNGAFCLNKKLDPDVYILKFNT